MLTIIQNERKAWSMTLRDSNGSPVDLTGAAVIVCFKASNNVLELSSAVGGRVIIDNALLGEISGHIAQAESDVMPPINNGDVEISLDFGNGDVRKTQILNSFIVKAKVC